MSSDRSPDEEDRVGPFAVLLVALLIFWVSFFNERGRAVPDAFTTMGPAAMETAMARPARAPLVAPNERE